MDNISTQIQRLKSAKSVTRYDACEELRVTTAIPQQAIDALKEAMHDPDPLVAEAAQRAITVHENPPQDKEVRANNIYLDHPLPVQKAMTSQTKQTLALIFLSALICGLIYSSHLPNYSGNRQIDWTIDWIDFLPGSVFGLLFASINVIKIFRKILYTLASGIIFFIAVRIFYAVSAFGLSDDLLLEGALAGFFGGTALTFISKVFNSTEINRGYVRTAALGGVAGIIFVNIVLWGTLLLENDLYSTAHEPGFFIWLIAFAAWQLPVGWSLTLSIQEYSRAKVA